MPAAHMLPLRRPARLGISWVDVLLLAGLAALVAGVVGLAHRWEAPLRPSVTIDLSLWALPKYTLLSLDRKSVV